MVIFKLNLCDKFKKIKWNLIIINFVCIKKLFDPLSKENFDINLDLISRRGSDVKVSIEFKSFITD